MKKTGLAYIDGAERGPVEKFAPPPRPNLGDNPQFYDSVLRGPSYPTNHEIFVKKSLPIFRKNFQKFTENFNFGG